MRLEKRIIPFLFNYLFKLFMSDSSFLCFKIEYLDFRKRKKFGKRHWVSKNELLKEFVNVKREKESDMHWEFPMYYKKNLNKQS